MESSWVKRRRLLMVPCPYQGHINPMLHLATFLHQNGFSITIAHTFFNSHHPYRHPEFTFLPLNDGITDHHVSSWDMASVLLAINENCRGSLEEAMAAMVGGDGEGSSEVLCIIHDELMYYCEGVASRFGVKSLVLRTTSAATCVSRCAVLQLHAAGLLPLTGRFEEEIPAKLHPLRSKDLPLPATSDFTKFHQLVLNMYTITTGRAVIWNTIPWLEPAQLTQIKAKFWEVPIFPIAPIQKIAPTSSSSSLLKEDSTCLSWLDKQAPNSVIYVSLGSMAVLTKQEVEEMGWGLVNSNQPFLWVVRPGLVRGSYGIELVIKEVEEKVGDRGCIVQWAPQKEVLGHGAVGGFLSHCGWNSTLESLSEGVPILCWPDFGDQRVNARYVSCVWGVGLALEDELDRKEVEKGIRRVMVGEEGREMREKAMDFKTRIEDSLMEDGSCSSSLKHLVDLIMSFID